ncbi:MAG: hypothetical protein HUK21_01925 [Fibrobacteraceae bacterium]|nr:hypothetical protein [Fibrobacteraceae bacterium]
MKNIRSVLILVAIIGGILIPQLYFLYVLQPFLIGSMMLLTFVSRVPPQQHGLTFRIELKAFVASFVLFALLYGVVELFHLPREVLLGGAIVILCPPANAVPAMAKMLGGNPVLALKIFLVGHLVACFTIPSVYGVLTHSDASVLDIALKVFNSMQPIISIPLAIAFGVRSFYPEVADRIEKFQKFTVFIWSFSVFCILSKASYDIRKMGFMGLVESGMFQSLAITAAVLCVVQFALGWFCERKGHPIEGAQSMGQKNTNLVIWISQLYAGPLAALVPTFYVVCQNLVLSWMSRSKK